MTRGGFQDTIYELSIMDVRVMYRMSRLREERYPLTKRVFGVDRPRDIQCDRAYEDIRNSITKEEFFELWYEISDDVVVDTRLSPYEIVQLLLRRRKLGLVPEVDVVVRRGNKKGGPGGSSSTFPVLKVTKNALFIKIHHGEEPKEFLWREFERCYRCGDLYVQPIHLVDNAHDLDELVHLYEDYTDTPPSADPMVEETIVLPIGMRSRRIC